MQCSNLKDAAIIPAGQLPRCKVMVQRGRLAKAGTAATTSLRRLGGQMKTLSALALLAVSMVAQAQTVNFTATYDISLDPSLEPNGPYAYGTASWTAEPAAPGATLSYTVQVFNNVPCLEAISGSTPITNLDVTLGGKTILANGTGVMSFGASESVGSSCSSFFGQVFGVGGSKGSTVFNISGGEFDQAYPNWRAAVAAPGNQQLATMLLGAGWSSTEGAISCTVPTVGTLVGGVDPCDMHVAAAAAAEVVEPPTLMLLALGGFAPLLARAKPRHGVTLPSSRAYRPDF